MPGWRVTCQGLPHLQGPLWHVAGQRWLPQRSFLLHTSSQGGQLPSQQRRLRQGVCHTTHGSHTQLLLINYESVLQMRKCSASAADPTLSQCCRPKQKRMGRPLLQTPCSASAADPKNWAGHCCRPHSLAGVSVAGLHVVALAVTAHVRGAQHLLGGAPTAARLGHQLTTHLRGFGWWRRLGR